MKQGEKCRYCGGLIEIRNPTGKCDHLYWPDMLTDEAKEANGFRLVNKKVWEKEPPMEVSGVTTRSEATQAARPLDRLVSWWRSRQTRKLAKKYGLDFEIECVFDYQLKPYGYPRNGQLCEVAMQSGNTAIYRAEITEFCPGNTGQKSWRFEFQGYKPANEPAKGRAESASSD